MDQQHSEDDSSCCEEGVRVAPKLRRKEEKAMENRLQQKIWSLQSRIEQELDEYYETFEPGTERLLAGLDQIMETREFGSSYEKKTAMHEFLCKTCEIHLFRELPFFFEMASGRDSSGTCQ